MAHAPPHLVRRSRNVKKMFWRGLFMITKDKDKVNPGIAEN